MRESQIHFWHSLVHSSPGFREGLTSVQFLSTEVVRVVAVVGEACGVVEEVTEGTGVVKGHGP